MGDWIKKNFKQYISTGYLKIEGRIKPSQIAERLKGAELVIVPSMNDNLPYVVFEMMALGKILLVSKQGGHSEVIEDGIDGFIFDHEFPETFYQQLNKILELKARDREKISQNALQKVNTFYGPESIYRQKIKILEKILSQNTSSRSGFPFIRPGKKKDNIIEEPGIKGLLSVVVPYYNMGRFVDETIQSLLGV
ncbi:MAG: glycosyltransferase family 4 protein [Bacteroidota bacterium]